MGDRNLAGNRPHKGRHFAGDRNYYLIDVLTSSHQAAIAFAQAHLAFQLISWIALGTVSNRSYKWRLTLAG